MSAQTEVEEFADGCVAEHSPGSNEECVMRPAEGPPMPEGGEVVEAPAPPPEDEVLPDMTETLIADMREGVHRYRALALTEDEQAEKYEKQAPLNRMEARSYRAKAATLTRMMKDLGFDPDDRSVSPEHPEGIHA